MHLKRTSVNFFIWFSDSQDKRLFALDYLKKKKESNEKKNLKGSLQVTLEE